jgi:hypothetical protein
MTLNISFLFWLCKKKTTSSTQGRQNSFFNMNFNNIYVFVKEFGAILIKKYPRSISADSFRYRFVQNAAVENSTKCC